MRIFHSQAEASAISASAIAGQHGFLGNVGSALTRCRVLSRGRRDRPVKGCPAMRKPTTPGAIQALIRPDILPSADAVAADQAVS